MNAVAVPAATLILFGPGGQHLLVQRAAHMAFAAGAVVFPGGRVDPGDRELAVRCATLDEADAAARVAAIRETLEEAGVGVGIVPTPDVALAAAMRAALTAGFSLASLLDEHRLALDLGALVPFARWCPNFPEARNFDTRFYLARLPAGAPAATVDETENVRLFWATAEDALAQAEAGQAKLIFPTRRNLERLATLPGFEAAAADAAAHPVERITPWVEARDGVDWLCIPSGLGYPVVAEPMEAVRRG